MLAQINIASKLYKVVHGTTVIHSDLQAIRSLITDLFRHGGINAITPTRRVTGGPVYAQFGSPIKSGIVPRPSGMAAIDAVGFRKGTDTAAHSVEPGSFVMNVAATKAFGY